ncbi:catalase-like domain-containing protein [Aspergillus granulosus]|uniref:Catalase n=1 Tax=Aspergillus granulosus TaxID=176169 RepID=A0ABR4I3Y4_9EURO
MSSSDVPVYTTSSGCPVYDPEASQRVGNNGPLLLQDFHLLDLLAHFDRERIPERVVHAKGAGAYGEFEVLDDISDITTINMLKEVGQKTRLLARFSTVGGEKGSADSVRDPRGFSIKFYTEEGNWDWVFNNTPIFFLREPSKFPLFIHTQKRNPQTNLKDATMFWDYLSTHQESAHQVMHLFSDRGTPYSYRHMSGYSGHTYKWTKPGPDGGFNYVQIHCKTDQGTKNFTHKEAAEMVTINPDWNTEDPFKAIQQGQYPSWTCYVQVLSPEQAEKFQWNVFDLTKVWPQSEVPLRRFGRITLNQNPENYFAEIEQAAFSPSHLVPGVEPSADPVLQARLFSYPDAHHHRLGINYQQIPVNCPLRAWNPYQRDGPMSVRGNYGSIPNYPSSFQPLRHHPSQTNGSTPGRAQEHEKWAGAVTVRQSPVTDHDFVQPRRLWHVLGKTPGQQENLIENIAVHLCNAEESVRRRTYGMFTRIDTGLGAQIEERTESIVGE